MKIFIVIPALNERESMGDLVHETLGQPNVDSVVVVDNGSTDDTAAVAQAAGAHVVSEPLRGYGFACKAGSNYAISQQADIIVYMDGDYSSLPSELGTILEPILSGSADLVLGSRTLGVIAENAMPPHQKFGNWLTSKIINLIFGEQITDLGPYRAITAELLEELNMQEMTFGWPTEMQVKSLALGKRVIEVPASWHNRRGGVSKVGGTIKGSILAGWYILGSTFRYRKFNKMQAQ